MSFILDTAKNKVDMDGSHKAAILLKNLDKSLAAKVLSQLPADQVELVTRRLAGLDGISLDQLDGVLEEFTEAMGALSLDDADGVQIADGLLERSLAQQQKGSMFGNTGTSASTAPFAFLQELGAEFLLVLIEDEHPQTIALIMSYLPAELSANVLRQLTPNIQMEAVRRIANMEPTRPEVIQDIESSLKTKMTSMLGHSSTATTKGISTAARILNVTDRSTNESILQNLERSDADLAKGLQKSMFEFDDILSLDDRSMRSLLNEVGHGQWSIALKGASIQIKQKVLASLSGHSAQMLTETMEDLGPITISKAESMQQEVVNTLRRLASAREITVKRAV